MTVTMLVPFARRGTATAQREVTLRRLPERPVLALIDNGKPKAGTLLEAFGSALVASGAISRYVIHRKRATLPITAVEREALLAEAHAVVSGIGDCGGCTACSVTDALRCLDLGVPSAVVVTTAFEGLADATEASYGLAGLGRLVVDHPIWNRDAGWFADRGVELAQAWRDVVSRSPEPVARSSGPEPPTPAGALAMLTASLEADGYTMRVDVDGQHVVLRVDAAAPDACPDCLVPSALFGDIAHAALVEAGFDYARAQIDVRLPVERPRPVTGTSS